MTGNVTCAFTGRWQIPAIARHGFFGEAPGRSTRARESASRARISGSARRQLGIDWGLEFDEAQVLAAKELRRTQAGGMNPPQRIDVTYGKTRT